MFPAACHSERAQSKCVQRIFCSNTADIFEELETSWQHIFFIHTGWVCIHGNFQEPLRFTTMSWNYLYCLMSFCLFLSLPLSQGSLEKENDLRKMEWTERGQFNICFYLIGNRGRILEECVGNQDRQKDTLNEIIFELFHIFSMHGCSFIQSGIVRKKNALGLLSVLSGAKWLTTEG